MYVYYNDFSYFYYVHIDLDSGNNFVIRLIYNAGTEIGSSGGPILVEEDHKLVIAGLHRGNETTKKEREGWDQVYNFGSHFSQISESVTKNKWDFKLLGD